MNNIIIEEYNDTADTVKNAEFVHNFRSPVLRNAEKYKVSITRLKVPTSGLEIFNLPSSEQSDYYMRIDYPTSNAAIANNNATSGNITLPINSDGWYNYSSLDVIEMINRRLQKSFDTVFEQYTSNDHVSTGSTVVVSAATSATTNEVVNVASMVKSCYIEFNIQSLTASDDEIPRRIYIETPTGKQMTVWSGSSLTGENMVGKTNILFVDRALLPFDKYKTNISEYQPLDSFIDGLSEMNGTWKVGVEADENITSTLTYDFKIVGLTASEGNLAPYFNVLSNNKLQFVHDGYFQKKNVGIYFSRKLAELVMFKENMKLNSAGTEYRYTYPQSIIDDANLSDIVQTNQNVSSYYKLRNLDKVVVESNHLNTLGESRLSSLPITDNILSDFIVPIDEDLEYLTYSIDANPFRKYRLENQGELHRIDIELYAKYTHGEKIKITYQPGENIFVRLTFFSDDEKTYV